MVHRCRRRRERWELASSYRPSMVRRRHNATHSNRPNLSIRARTSELQIVLWVKQRRSEIAPVMRPGVPCMYVCMCAVCIFQQKARRT